MSLSTLTFPSLVVHLALKLSASALLSPSSLHFLFLSCNPSARLHVAAHATKIIPIVPFDRRNKFILSTESSQIMKTSASLRSSGVMLAPAPGTNLPLCVHEGERGACTSQECTWGSAWRIRDSDGEWWCRQRRGEGILVSEGVEVMRRSGTCYSMWAQ